MKTLKYFLLTLFVSLGVVLIYDTYREPTTIIIREENPLALQAANVVRPSSTPPDFTYSADKSLKAVVFIRSTKESRNVSRTSRESRNSTGSGVIISHDGTLVTNYHVVKDAESVNVTLSDNREFKAEMLGYDSATDLAVLKIQEHNLAHLPFGNSDSLKIGEWVLAIGNPFRLQSTVTAGIVSAKARSINVYDNSDIESFIQTDAAVNPGNSGGALINTSGELIGINTAILSQNGGYEGFSFAIPSILVKKVVFDIKEYGSVQRGWLGITIVNVDNHYAESNGLDEVRGIYIQTVNKNSAASAAGLRKGDVILSVNEINVDSSPEFMGQIAIYRPGDEVNIKLIRDGSTRNIKATLRNFLNTTDYVNVFKDGVLNELGLEIRNLNSKERSRLSRNGVLVTSILANGVLDKTNMEPNYIITSINDKRVNTAEECIALLEKADGLVLFDGYYESYPGSFPYRFYK